MGSRETLGPRSGTGREDGSGLLIGRPTPLGPFVQGAPVGRTSEEVVDEVPAQGPPPRRREGVERLEVRGGIEPDDVRHPRTGGFEEGPGPPVIVRHP